MKLKTKRSAAKRFRLTGTGKIKRRHSGHRHILTKKSAKRKRNLNQWSMVSASDAKRVRKMLHLSN